MIRSSIHLLSQCAGVVECAGGVDPGFRELETRQGLSLPADHKQVLRWHNGFTVFHGAFRFFGVGSANDTDSISWNDRSCWKFAWGRRCDGYWCFAETVWGDQYAYRLDDLAGGGSAVFFLDALSMSARRIAPHFAAFFEEELLRNAQTPYDQMIVEAYHALGPIEANVTLVYMPPLLLGGTENIANVQKMKRRAAMICNGDIAVQLDEGPENGEVVGMGTFQDECGRTRIKLLWQT